MTQPNTVGDLRAAFETLGATRERGGELQALQNQINIAVDGMKAAGIPPERVIVTIRELATSAGLQRRDAQLFDRLIGWCIDRYYDSR